jgi:hypothetical protein
LTYRRICDIIPPIWLGRNRWHGLALPETKSFRKEGNMRSVTPNPAAPWLMLISRSALFLIFQVAIAALFWLGGSRNPWGESSRWWMIFVILANFVSIYLLVHAFRAEGKRFLDILRFSRQTLKTDLLWLASTSIIGLPIVAAPMGNLAVAIYGDAMTPIRLLFQPIPAWALAVGLLFPLTIGFAELTTYFGYVMPRLAVQLRSGWAAWLLASLFLGVQHCFLPLILDGRYLLWRGGMYLPFALFAGLLLKLRPSLLPYFAVIHTLIDISVVSVYLML